MKRKKQKSVIQEFKDGYRTGVKKRRRRKLITKGKLTLTVILPVFILLLSVKVLKTCIHIKARSLFAKPQPTPSDKEAPSAPAVPVPAKMTPVEKEIIKPVSLSMHEPA